MPSKNNIEKKLLAVADDNKHIELEIANTLKQMFDTAVKEGFKGTFKQYQDSLSLDQLKRINLGGGGKVIKFAKTKEPKETKKINLEAYVKLGQAVSVLSDADREIVSALLKKSGLDN